ncbi:GLYCOGENIN [Ceraceosorus bombacis]|uniref:GLYCOGENIN n=1 Tax=Ceraceosorus bombacis TaxID=401625 RepID=A0A0P1BKG9_9BASI|nr:GLYCOGENIN [Ceraceosorus bombacis]
MLVHSSFTSVPPLAFQLPSMRDMLRSHELLAASYERLDNEDVEGRHNKTYRWHSRMCGGTRALPVIVILILVSVISTAYVLWIPSPTRSSTMSSKAGLDDSSFAKDEGEDHVKLSISSRNAYVTYATDANALCNTLIAHDTLLQTSPRADIDRVVIVPTTLPLGRYQQGLEQLGVNVHRHDLLARSSFSTWSHSLTKLSIFSARRNLRSRSIL